MADAAETDEGLMLRYAGGDAEAFTTLYRRHEMRVWRYLYRSVRNRATADELMQDVWFAVARQASRYRPTARFTTWLLTLAHNRTIDAFRASRPQVSIDAADPATPGLAESMTAAAGSDPAAATQSHDEAAALIAAVERLPDEQRAAFLLQAEGELSVEDIASATGASFETTKSRLRYARAKLRQLLWEYA
jgi:RNA polymerase sigma-70 factor, ECF subfamily